MLCIIDRFEGDIAVCEDESRRRILINKKTLPAAAREGSVMAIKEDGRAELVTDDGRVCRIAKKMEKIWADKS